MCIFPYGDMPGGEPKTGAIRLARQTGVPIVPVRLDNVLAADSHHGIASYFRQPKTVTITFLPPVHFSQGTESPEKLHHDTDSIISLLQ